MTCPVCGSESITPLVIRSVEHLAGAVKVCEECSAVFLIVNDAWLPEGVMEHTADSWRTIRLQIDAAIDAICDHPAIREVLGSPQFEIDVWRRDLAMILERTIALLVPTIRDVSCIRPEATWPSGIELRMLQSALA